MNPQQLHEYNEAHDAGHQFFYDQIPMYYPQTIDLVNAIKKKKPDLIVVKGSRSISKYRDDKLIVFYRDLDLAYAGNPDEVVGSIGFDGESYSITSRLIQNAKFAHWNTYDHNSKRSKHMNNVVKDAMKYLLPTQFHEVYNGCKSGIDRSLAEIREKAREGMNRRLRNVGPSTLRDELTYMSSIGYIPKNSEVAEAMKYIQENKEEYERNANYNPEVRFIWIKPDCVMYGDGKDLEEYKSKDDLPEAVREKMFVLMVADINNFIDEVGMKMAENKFWVML